MYQGRVKELLQQYKFRDQKQLASLWAHFLARLLSDGGKQILLVPVPGRRVSVRMRGWDQTNEILRQLYRLYGYPMKEVLTRSGGESQKSLSYEGRMENLRGRIVMGNKKIDPTVKIVLVDDIFTTGASLNESAKVLRDNGMKEIEAVTIARAPY